MLSSYYLPLPSIVIRSRDRNFSLYWLHTFIKKRVNEIFCRQNGQNGDRHEKVEMFLGRRRKKAKIDSEEYICIKFDTIALNIYIYIKVWKLFLTNLTSSVNKFSLGLYTIIKFEMEQKLDSKISACRNFQRVLISFRRWEIFERNSPRSTIFAYFRLGA